MGLSARPVVLRCSRCGRFVDWEEARVQIVCGCRPHLTLPAVIVRPEQDDDRAAALALIRRDFGHTRIVAFGEPVQIDGQPIVVATVKGELAGAVVYRLLPAAVQILALATDPMWQRSGVAGQLLDEVERMAGDRGLQRLVVSTTNDNLPALYFYQRRGYQIAEVVPGGLLPHVRDPKGGGFAGIPMRDEVRLERTL
jgi:ribosomal protein S18 acetylase RimI-like enzyme